MKPIEKKLRENVEVPLHNSGSEEQQPGLDTERQANVSPKLLTNEMALDMIEEICRNHCYPINCGN